ncbi:hypothetical protein HT031_003054 [Scenedesmus sp. PABB004]|nr:hypothetical protein HT031_003054 [Scenedesmus sp. PABB004]
MAAWAGDAAPRALAPPAPYGSGGQRPGQLAAGGGKPDTTIRAMRDKLADVSAENGLLGGLVKELKVRRRLQDAERTRPPARPHARAPAPKPPRARAQAERDALSKRLAATARQLAEANGRAAAADAGADAGRKEAARLAAEVERLSSVAHSQALRLQKSKAHQQELEEVALDLRAELEEAAAQRADAEAGAAAAAQRCAASEAKLVAAGLGPLPAMGPTAEQLIISSTQRIQELTDNLAAARADAEAREASWREQAAAAAQRSAQQEAAAAVLTGRLEESERQSGQLRELLVGLQVRAADGEALAQAQAELQRLRSDMLGQAQGLQQRVCELQGRLADAELAHAAALAEQQGALAAAQRGAAALQREKRELVASLAAVRQQESAHRLAAGEAAAKAERLRGELVKCVGELQAQLEAAAAAGAAHASALQQLRALESTAAAARAEAAESRQQLVELASATVAELRRAVGGEAAAVTGLPHGVDGSALPAPVAEYVKVLEHAVCDCEAHCRQLAADAQAARAAEGDVRAALAAAREAQAAAERALTQQTQRLLAAERMRLADLREAQSLEKRLVLAQQEAWNLRDALLEHRAADAAAALEAGAARCGGVGGAPLALAAAAQPQAAAAAEPAPPGPQSAPAPAPAPPGPHQTKLAQLRQLKQQLAQAGASGGARAVAGLAPRSCGADPGAGGRDRAGDDGQAAGAQRRRHSLRARTSSSDGGGGPQPGGTD